MKKFSMISLGCCLVAVIMTFGLLAGCGSSTSNTPGTSAVTSTTQAEGTQAPTTSDPVTITVASSANWIKDIDKTLADQYKEKSGNKIEFISTPDDQYSNVLKAKFATAEGPDVYYMMGGTNMKEFLPEQHALDLSNEPWVARLTDWAKAGTTLDGKVYALNTWSVDGWGLLYDPEIFSEFGLSVPKTYEDFVKVCETIKANGITPIYEPGKAEWHQEIWLNSFAAMVAQKNPGLYDKLNSNQAKFADIQDLELGLLQMKEIADKGYFGKNYLTNTWETMVDNMGSGKYAMGLVYTTFQNEVLAKFPDSKADTWQMFPVPLAGNTSFATSAGGVVRSVNKDSKVIDAVKDYFNFLVQPENLKAFYAARADLGPTSFKDVEGKMPQAYSSMIQNSAGGTGLDFEGGVQFWNQSTIGKLVQELYLGGKTPKQVLEAIDAERAKMF